MSRRLSVNAYLLVVFVIMTTTLVYVLTSGIERAVDPVSLLPGDTAFLVDLKKPTISVNRLSRSPLGRQMASVEWQELLRATGMQEDDALYFVNRIRALNKVTGSTFFSELTGQRLLLGLIPASEAKRFQEDEEKPAYQVVIIARPLHKALLVDYLLSFFVTEYRYTEQSYQGRVINTYILDNNLSFFSSVTDGLFIASFSTEAVQRSIDISLENMTAGQSGLPGNTSYNRLRKRAGGKGDLFVYMNSATMRNIMYPATESDRNSLQSAVQNVAFFRQPQKKLIRYSCIIQYDPDRVGHNSSFLQSYQSGQDTVLALLPDDIIAHVWTNVFNMAAAWDLMQSRPYSFLQPYAHDFAAWLAKNTALTVSDFLSLFGGRASLNVTAVKSAGFFPIPRIYLRVEVNDQEKAAYLMEQLFAGLKVNQARKNNIKISTIMLAGGLMQPSYMITDGFLVLGDSRQQLENFLQKDKATLLNSPLFAKIDVGLARKNNLIIYHRGAELIDGVKELLLWYGSLLPPGENNSGRQSKVILKTIIVPILENMKKYTAKSARIYNNGSEIVIQSALLMEK